MTATYKYPDCRIVIFAKAPVAGKTKTRLQPELSPQQSAALQQKFIWQICNTVNNSHLSKAELWCTPDTEHPAFIKAAAQFDISRHKQIGNNLGERLWHCLQTQAEQTTVILGTDCPYLQTTHLDKLLYAIKSNNHDISIIPAEDGGYVALACKRAVKALFADINWGSDQVYAQTLAAAEKNQLQIQAFTALSDVDTYDDYLQMCKNLPNLAI